MRFLLLLTLFVSPVFGAEQEKSAEKATAETPQAEEETVLTPFGRVKKQAPKPKPEPRPDVAPTVDVEVVDGVATFKRQTPFGMQSWKRPVDQLSADEKKLLEQSRAAAAGKTKSAAKSEAKEAIVIEPR